MKKFFILGCVVLLLAGCGTNQDQDTSVSGEQQKVHVNQLVTWSKTNQTGEKMETSTLSSGNKKNHDEASLSRDEEKERDSSQTWWLEKVSFVANQTTKGVVDGKNDFCGIVGDHYKQGSFTLQKSDQTLSFDSLVFVENTEFDATVDHHVVGGKDVFVYFQPNAANCTELEAFAVSYDKKDGFVPLSWYYPTADTTEEFVSVLTRQDIYADGSWLVVVMGNGWVGWFSEHYFAHKDDTFVNLVTRQHSLNSSLALKWSTLSENATDKIASNLLFSIQPNFVDYSTLDNIDKDPEYAGSIYHANTYNEGFANGITYVVYEFADASSFDYVVDVRHNEKSVYLLTHVSHYEINKDGTHLYAAYHLYDEYQDSRIKKHVMIDVAAATVDELNNYACMWWEMWGNHQFQWNTLISYGPVGTTNEPEGATPVEICLYDYSDKSYKWRYTTELQWLSFPASIDIVGLHKTKDNILYIARPDPADAMGAISDKPYITQRYSLYQIANGSIAAEEHFVITQPNLWVDTPSFAPDHYKLDEQLSSFIPQ